MKASLTTFNDNSKNNSDTNSKNNYIFVHIVEPRTR